MLIIALHFLSLRGGAVCGETVALFAVKWVALFGRNNHYRNIQYYLKLYKTSKTEKLKCFHAE
jgi:hypothetical protein